MKTRVSTKELPTRCYNCRVEIKKGLFCKECEDKPDRGKGSAGILKIYNKV